MITATFIKSNGEFTGFTVSGHSGYANSGEDIVCAGVSSAVQLTVNAITECFGVAAVVTVEKDRIGLQLPKGCDNTAVKTLLQALYLHIDLLSADYKGTIKTHISEV